LNNDATPSTFAALVKGVKKRQPFLGDATDRALDETVRSRMLRHNARELFDFPEPP